ncbi:hypothetical protein I2486_21395 [Cellulophaga sp. E16_2]|uniref:hypothetical protein n=1 Tax=Cellulophaga sp. E16_2 TaxID=2789297 RepID=UPI001A92273C|nr:hypothetical protein [Cellulophaga sp. E16_2]MBO0593963.1 hypothetical protein [Cellulophaga sp. E16_2]
MNTRKSIVNKLELAYAPLTGYEFAFVKKDPLIELAIEQASLYIIGQRPVITFENVYPDQSEYVLKFEIHQKGNPNILKGKLPLIQKSADCKPDDTIGVAFNFFDKETDKKLPYGNLHGFSLVKHIGDKQEFLLWFSPEKLLQNWWKQQIDCEIEGDYKSFLNYKVHYVGKATKQSILKRLTGHSTFQDILSLENPINYKDLPAHEIAILCFKFQDNLQFQIFGDNADIKEMTASIMGENFPKQETIFLDAEKALIRAMEPDYNKELFKAYPKSKDGLFNDNYSYISYSLVDPITLTYNQGEIIGELSYDGGDSIIIKNNKEVSLVKKG